MTINIIYSAASIELILALFRDDRLLNSLLMSSKALPFVSGIKKHPKNTSTKQTDAYNQ